MATYLYFCEIHGEFEEDHSIHVKLTECPKCKEKDNKITPIKRLIAGGTNFHLMGSCWARDNYK